MERDKLRQFLQRKPFQPFRIVLNDNRVFDVHYPEMNLLARSYVKVGIPESGAPHPVCDHTEFVPLSRIVRIELLPTAEAPLAS